MRANIPTPQEIQAALEPLTYAQVQQLARVSGVPLTTLWKVRTGETTNPGIATVRKFLPHLRAVKKVAAQSMGGNVVSTAFGSNP